MRKVVGAASLAVALAGACMFTTAAASPAKAGSGYDWVLTTKVGSTTGLASKAANGRMQPALVMGGSAGCYGQTDQPHDSHHVSGTINVVARTVCPTTDYVHVELLKEHWYGLEFLHSNKQTRYGKAQANAAGDCKKGENYTFYGVSDHEGAGAGTATTVNHKNITCNPYIK